MLFFKKKRKACYSSGFGINRSSRDLAPLAARLCSSMAICSFEMEREEIFKDKAGPWYPIHPPGHVSPPLPCPHHRPIFPSIPSYMTLRPHVTVSSHPPTAPLLSQTTKLGGFSHLSDPFHSFCFHIPPRVQEPLLAQINALHARNILRGRPRHAGRDDDRVCLEDYTFVDDLIDGERKKIVVFNESAFVGGISVGGCILAFNLDLMEWKRSRDRRKGGVDVIIECATDISYEMRRAERGSAQVGARVMNWIELNGMGRKRIKANFRRIASESLSAKTTLKSKISFSSPPPTT